MTPDPTPDYASCITAVGRMLRSKCGEPRILERIRVNEDGVGEVIRWEQLPNE